MVDWPGSEVHGGHRGEKAAPSVLPGASSVCLVGAGPGAPDLLTVRALRRLEAAEVVVHDRLIAPDILALVPPAAERIDVGKAAGRHPVPQHRIHAILIEQARAGKRVVRLKGGDPYVFGRGGEEVQALLAAGIGVEVVPGITASVGCAASAGIPLTHRDLASHCLLLPGHLADGHPGLDWAMLARPRQTLVFYMGVQRLPHISAQLQQHGLPAETPAAVVLDGTRPEEVVIATTLQRLPDRIAADGVRPGLLIIGESVRLSPHFDAAVEGVSLTAPATHDGPPAAVD